MVESVFSSFHDSVWAFCNMEIGNHRNCNMHIRNFNYRSFSPIHSDKVKYKLIKVTICFA